MPFSTARRRFEKPSPYRSYSSELLADAVEIDRSVPGSVPAAGGTLTTARNAGNDSCPDTDASRATVFTAVASIMCASRKCLYLVYLNVCGEVAERLKAAVC